MQKSNVNPTADIYGQLQVVTDWLNASLFDGTLPAIMLTLQRAKNSAGYFSPVKWINLDGVKVGEMSLNPTYIANRPLIQLFQTIAHEQCHLWQHTYGNPSRFGYHNNEWANKMIEIGLMPSSSGEIGGAKTGQKMSDYPIENGKFIQSCLELVESKFSLKWNDRGSEPAIYRAIEVPNTKISNQLRDQLYIPTAKFFPELDTHISVETASKRKTKYKCLQCNLCLWGKSGLSIICQACEKKVIEVT